MPFELKTIRHETAFREQLLSQPGAQGLSAQQRQERGQDAHGQLLKMQTHLNGKTGWLRITDWASNAKDPDSTMNLKRRGWFKNWAFSKGAAQDKSDVKLTNNFLLIRMQEAYQDKLPPAEFKKIMADVEAYLGKTTDKKGEARYAQSMGSRHLVRFIDRFEHSVKSTAREKHQAHLDEIHAPDASKPPPSEALFSMDPQTTTVNKNQLPQSLGFRAGAEGRSNLSNEIQADLQTFDKGMSYAPLAKDLVSDPRAKQFLMDVARIDISYGGQSIGSKGEQGLLRLRDALSETFAGSENKIGNALRDLTHLLNQQGVVGAYAVACMHRKEGLAPWFTNADGIQTIDVLPEGEPASSVVINATVQAGHEKPSMMYQGKPVGLMDADGQPLPFEDKTVLQIRYTPSEEVNQPGTVEYLDIRSYFSLSEPPSQRHVPLVPLEELESFNDSYYAERLNFIEEPLRAKKTLE